MSSETATLPIATPTPHPTSFLLVGNPNAGKTTLFNGLTGLRAKTSNFPGTTLEHRVGRMILDGRDVTLIDLPGLYGINSATEEELVTRKALAGELPGLPTPGGVVLLADATNLERNLFLASEVLEFGRPTVVALNMVDLAERDGIKIDVERLSEELGCPVVPIAARSGRGLDELKRVLQTLIDPPHPLALATVRQEIDGCGSCPFATRYDWAENVGRRCMHGTPMSHGQQTERIDKVLTHPLVGTLAFLGVMLGMLSLIFWLAQYPMGWIEGGFATVGSAIAEVLPAGDLRSLFVDGLIGGVGGVLVFLPQICILFFFLALLEDTGYLARAAFVMDRLMRKVGLPGKAFVPMLSAHACAVPAIMSTRVIDGWRDRLVTILVLPLLTCSARIPVYSMIVGLLFFDRPLIGAAAFTGAYVLGIAAALLMAFLFKHTILPGDTRALILELPGYKVPGLRNALLFTADRAWLFVRNAGTTILVISMALWALATYPKSEPPAEARALQIRAEQALAGGRIDEAQRLDAEADNLVRRNALVHSAAGRLGRFIEPAIRPLGFDWQIGLGVISSFAAREVIVSTLGIVYGVGEEAVDGDSRGLLESLRRATRSDGTPVYGPATSLSLLVFYVLAMQCLPTQVVTRRETGGWRWPLFQLGYMTALAYAASLVTYQIASRLF